MTHSMHDTHYKWPDEVGTDWYGYEPTMYLIRLLIEDLVVDFHQNYEVSNSVSFYKIWGTDFDDDGGYDASPLDWSHDEKFGAFEEFPVDVLPVEDKVQCYQLRWNWKILVYTIYNQCVTSWWNWGIWALNFPHIAQSANS